MIDNTEPVLLDTSVWIDALRGKTPEIVAETQALLNDDRVLTCGPVLFEIKRGITIPTMDVLIAQICLHYKVYLFTLDEHFQSVPGLKLFTAK